MIRGFFVALALLLSQNSFALQSIHDTPLQAWKLRGRFHQTFTAYRLKPEWQKFVTGLVKQGEAFLGRPYDYKYDLDEERIDGSELLYKAMLNASGVRLGKLQKLGDLRWQPYRTTIEKYEGGKPPLDCQMITPQSLSEAKELELVYQGYKP